MLRSLRARVAAAAVVTVALVLVVAGGLLLRGDAVQRGEELDTALDRRVDALSAGDLQDLPTDGDRRGPHHRFPRGDEFVARVLDGDVVTAGHRDAGFLPAGEQLGFDTVPGPGGPWRVRTAAGDDGTLVQVAAPLSSVNRGAFETRRRALRLGLFGLLLTGLLGWAAGGVALRPLSQLTAAARRVAATRDLSTRMPPRAGPAEVDAVADSLDVMLGRLEESAAGTTTALEASRRFAADAGHELRTPLTSVRANLDALARNPDLPPAERARILADVTREQDRLVGLLDALQALARGDASPPPPEPVDLAEVADAAVERIRAGHPGLAVELAAGHEDLTIAGSADGLRIVVDDLLLNAARHGRGDGTVRVRLERDGADCVLAVDDDGPGIPVPDRSRVLERFARGAAAAGPGSGLGLALVHQQVRLHGGTLAIGDSDLGGARISVRLPRAGRSPRR